MRRLLTLFLLTALTIFIVWQHLRQGEFTVDFGAVMTVIMGQGQELDQTTQAIIALRINRLLLALGCGAALGMAGHLMQSLFNNPLVDPFTTGTASAAALGANLVILGLFPVAIPLQFLAPGIGSVLALIITLLVLSIGKRWGNGQSGSILLVGIGFSSLLGAVNSLLTYMAGDENRLKSIIFWAMGGFGTAEPTLTAILLVVVCLVGVLTVVLHRHILMLGLGLERAKQLGMQGQQVYWLVLIGSSLMVGFAVAQAGIIGFVGLMVPHLVRYVLGPGKVWTTVWCGIVGALLVSMADVVARLAYPPAGLPVGIVTSLAGLPFFVYLLGIFASPKTTPQF